MDENLQQKIVERNNVRQLCGHMQSTKDYKHLLPKVINYMAHHDIGVKRIAYSAYARHSHKVAGEALLAINTLLHDSCHQSPLVRALVLNTLTYIRNESIAGIHQRIITDGLRDTSAFVRRHAVICQHYFTHSSENEPTKLLLEDPDPIVSTLSLVTSDCSVDGDSLAYCLKRMQGFTVDGTVQVLDVLKSHVPTGQQQILDVLNVLDPLLETEHIDVVTAAMDIFILCSKQADKSLAADIHSRVLKCCLLYLRSSDSSHVYCMLLWLHECLLTNPPLGETTFTSSLDGGTTLNYEIIADNYHLLLDKPSDPPHLTKLKLDILSLFITPSNVSIVTDNFKSIMQSKYKMAAICDAALTFAITARHKHKDSFGEALNALLSTSQPELQISLLKHIPSICTYSHPDCEKLFTAVLPRWKTLNHSDLLALLNLSSHFASNQSENLTHMLAMTDHILSTPSTQSVKVILLDSLTSAFLAQPAEYLQCLSRCLRLLELDSDQLVSQQVSWCLLKLKKNIKN